MDIIFIILGAIAILAGIAGCILPLLPGPPVTWLGLLFLHFSKQAHLSTRLLIITAIVTLLVSILDYLLPIWTTKRFGGTKAGQRGAAIGIIIGFFTGPWGIVLGPLIGSFIGEIIARPKEHKRAFKSATGAFIGFLLNTGIKIIWCVIMAWFFVEAIT